MIKSFLLTVAIWGSLVIGACAAVDSVSRQPTSFEKVCTQLKADCSDLAPPIVVYTQLTDLAGALGIYVMGEPYVFITSREEYRWKRPILIIHETTHYVAFQLGWKLDRCASEALARSVTVELTGEPIDPRWRERYGCVSDTKS